MKLEGVNNIFIDEISILTCHNMYKILVQLSKALNAFDLPFGDMNIIFARDFAQLPPVGGLSLYSESIETQVHSGLKLVVRRLQLAKFYGIKLQLLLY